MSRVRRENRENQPPKFNYDREFTEHQYPSTRSPTFDDDYLWSREALQRNGRSADCEDDEIIPTRYSDGNHYHGDQQMRRRRTLKRSIHESHIPRDDLYLTHHQRAYNGGIPTTVHPEDRSSVSQPRLVQHSTVRTSSTEFESQADRVKNRLKAMHLNPPARTSDSLSKLRDKIKEQQLKRDTRDHETDSLINGESYLSGEKPSRPLPRKVAEGMEPPCYKGFSLVQDGRPTRSRSDPRLTETTATSTHQHHRPRKVVTGGSNSPPRYRLQGGGCNEVVHTTDWRRGQDLIRRQLGHNPVLVTSVDVEDTVKKSEQSVGDLRPDGTSVEDNLQATGTLSTKKRRTTPLKEGGVEGGPKTSKTRHYDAAAIRSYLKEQREARQKQNKDKANTLVAEKEERQRKLEVLRQHQMEGATKSLPRPGRKKRPAPRMQHSSESPGPLRAGPRVSWGDDRVNQLIDEEHQYLPVEEPIVPVTASFTRPQARSRSMQQDASLSDDEATLGAAVWPPPCALAGRVSPFKFQEVWPAAAGPARPREQENEPRKDALQESALTIQSRLRQFLRTAAATATKEPSGVVESRAHPAPVQEEHRAGLGGPVEYGGEVEPPEPEEDEEEGSVSSSDVPPTRYARLMTGANKARRRIAFEDEDLPGGRRDPQLAASRIQAAFRGHKVRRGLRAFEYDTEQDLDLSCDYRFRTSVTKPPQTVLHHDQHRHSQALNPVRSTFRLTEKTTTTLTTSNKTARVVSMTTKSTATASHRHHHTRSSHGQDPFRFVKVYKKTKKTRHGGGDLPSQQSSGQQDYEEDTFSSVSETALPTQSPQMGAAPSTPGSWGSNRHRSSGTPRVRAASREMESAGVDMEVTYEDDFASSHDHSELVTHQHRTVVDEMTQEEHSEVQTPQHTTPRRPLPPPNTGTSRVPDGRLSPRSLELRLMAELHYMESMDASLIQMNEVERLRAVSLAQQETVSLAQILKSRQATQAQEVQAAILEANKAQYQTNVVEMKELRQKSLDAARNLAELGIKLATDVAVEPHGRVPGPAHRSLQASSRSSSARGGPVRPPAGSLKPSRSSRSTQSSTSYERSQTTSDSSTLKSAPPIVGEEVVDDYSESVYDDSTTADVNMDLDYEKAPPQPRNKERHRSHDKEASSTTVSIDEEDEVSDRHDEDSSQTISLEKKQLSERERKLHERRKQASELLKWKRDSEEKVVRAKVVKKPEDKKKKDQDKKSHHTREKQATHKKDQPPKKHRHDDLSSRRRSSSPPAVVSAVSTARSEDSTTAGMPQRLNLGGVAGGSDVDEIPEDVMSGADSSIQTGPGRRRLASGSSIQEDIDGDTTSVSIGEDLSSRINTPRSETTDYSQGTSSRPTSATSSQHSYTSYSRDSFDTPSSASETSAKTKKKRDKREDRTRHSATTSPMPMKRRLGSDSPRSSPADKRKQASEDEDSNTVSNSETVSDVGDRESRVRALRSELKQRQEVADQLKRKQARMKRDKLIKKETALNTQIQMYDKFISDIEVEMQENEQNMSSEMEPPPALSPHPRPQIKAPRAVVHTAVSAAAVPTPGGEEEAYSEDFSATESHSKTGVETSIATEVKEDDSSQATAWTPRGSKRLTFSEINEEYSASDRDSPSDLSQVLPNADRKKRRSPAASGPEASISTVITDSEDGRAGSQVSEEDNELGLPKLDLKLVSSTVEKKAVSPRQEEANDSPRLPGGDVLQSVDKIPLSARTIHSEMSDIPEDLPATESSSEDENKSKSRSDSRGSMDTDVQYSEEFSEEASDEAHKSLPGVESGETSQPLTYEPTEKEESSATSETLTSTSETSEETATEVDDAVEEVVVKKEEVTNATVDQITDSLFRHTLEDTLALTIGIAGQESKQKVVHTAGSRGGVHLEQGGGGLSEDLLMDAIETTIEIRRHKQLVLKGEEVVTTAKDRLRMAATADERQPTLRLEHQMSEKAKKEAEHTAQLGGGLKVGPASPDSGVSSGKEEEKVETKALRRIVVEDKRKRAVVKEEHDGEEVEKSEESSDEEEEEEGNDAGEEEESEDSDEGEDGEAGVEAIWNEIDLAAVKAQLAQLVVHDVSSVADLVNATVTRVWQARRDQGDRPWLATGIMKEDPPEDIIRPDLGEDENELLNSLLTSGAPNTHLDRRLVFDLACDVIQEVYEGEETLDTPAPWMKPMVAVARPKYRLWRGVRCPTSMDRLQSIVSEEVCSLLRLDDSAPPKRVSKLSQWTAHKKRDRVDEILVSELRDEEAGWTRYDEDELAVKMQLADTLMETMLADTVAAVGNAIRTKHEAQTY